MRHDFVIFSDWFIRIIQGVGGGPQRLDHLRGELSYSQKLKIIQTSGSLSERMG